MSFIVCWLLLSTPAHSVFLCAGDIRLVNGSDPSEGRIELFYEEEWRRVLNNIPDGSDTTDVAHVACQQAGYPYTEGTQSFGRGSGPVWILISTCTGDEERLEQCDHLGWKFDPCFFCADLGVQCRGECLQIEDIHTHTHTHTHARTHTNAHTHTHTHTHTYIHTHMHTHTHTHTHTYTHTTKE